MKRRLFFFALALSIPLALFLLARNAATFRPQTAAPASLQSLLLTTPRVDLIRSLSGRFFASNAYDSPAVLWDLKNPDARREIPRGLPVFSPDEKWLAIVTPSYKMFERYDLAPARVRVHLENLESGAATELQSVPYATPRNFNLEIRDGIFSPDGATFTAVSATGIFRWNLQNGKLISKLQGRFFDTGQEIGLFAGGAKIWGRTNLEFAVFDARTAKRERTFDHSGVLLTDERFYLGDIEGTNNSQIYRVAGGARVFEPLTTRFVFSPDGRWLLLERESDGARVRVELLEVGSWRVIARRSLNEFDNWIFEDADHVLTQGGKTGVTRWRLR